MKRSKRYKEAKKKVSVEAMDLVDAIAMVKETSTTNFDGGVELHINLNIDPKQSDQMVRGTVILPYGTGKTKKVAAFVLAGKEKEAVGADVVYSEQDIEKIAQTGKVEFDIAVATPDMMRHLGKIAKMLGQKGVMPNPRTETIGPNIAQMIEGLKGGKVAFKTDDSGNIHQIVGRVSFDNVKIKENVETMIEAVRKARPDGAKGTFITSVYLVSSMGPSVLTKV